MVQHPFFNLYLHTDSELETILNSKLLERTTLHEWPLSKVEKLITSTGEKWIYKTQYGPTVEAEVYAQLQSSLLIKAKPLAHLDSGHMMMLFEYLESPLLKTDNLSAQDVLMVGQELMAEIARMKGPLPFYLDISSEGKWLSVMESMLLELERLVSSKTFKAVDVATLAHLKTRILSEEVLAALSEDTGYVHNDLSGDNVFRHLGGYRIIDWQRPMLGPIKLDLVTLLESFAREPSHYLARGIVWMMYLLRIHWFTACASKWFPAGAETYDKEIMRLVKTKLS